MKTLRAVFLLIENADRVKAVRGMNFVRHSYIKNGAVHQKHDLRLTLFKLMFATKILIKGA
jgi:hypothetical protein